MFPTPEPTRFRDYVEDPRCKPHLSQIAAEVLAITRANSSVPRNGGGWLFTRFMLTGFATHLAMERLGVQVFESYPYLAFALWKQRGENLPPKSRHSQALIARQEIIARLARQSGVTVPPPRTLDEADAAAMTLVLRLAATKMEGVPVIESKLHGRFMVALQASDLSPALVEL